MSGIRPVWSESSLFAWRKLGSLATRPSVESPWTQWTLSIDIVWLEYWNESPWTMSTESMDIVHWVHGQHPLSPWTLSTQSMDNVHSVHGQCPLRLWTISTESMDNVHLIAGLFPWVFIFFNQIRLDFVQWVHGQSMDSVDIVQFAWTPMDNVKTVHWVHGHCPLSPWIISTESMDIVQSGWSHWTLSMDSMNFVQSIHGHCPDCPLSPC